MEIQLHHFNNTCVAEIQSDQVIIRDAQEALDVMANCVYQGADSIVIQAKNMDPTFFDLKTKLAGEILQKFSNYRVRLGIAGDISGYTSQSKSLSDFVYESNQGRNIVFTPSVAEALEKLSGKI